jgi:C4-dicarboxylate-specific signal transduction histidine kinase
MTGFSVEGADEPVAANALLGAGTTGGNLRHASEQCWHGQAPQDGFEITFMRKNGERFNALVYEAKLIDGNGKHTGWMASVLDITERKRAEELARQQQEQLQFTSRLVTMGEMASTLAHELNQPLAAIASYNTGCLNLLLEGARLRSAGIAPRTGKDRRSGPARWQDHSPRP